MGGDSILQSAIIECVRGEAGEGRVHAILHYQTNRLHPQLDQPLEETLRQTSTEGRREGGREGGKEGREGERMYYIYGGTATCLRVH